MKKGIILLINLKVNCKSKYHFLWNIMKYIVSVQYYTFHLNFFSVLFDKMELSSYLKFDIEGAVLYILALFSECNTIKSVVP